MKTTIIISILAVCLLGTIGWGVITQNRIQAQERMISELEGTVALREELINQLHEEYEQLHEDHTHLNEDYVQLNQEYAELSQDYAQLNEDHAQLNQEYAELSQDYAQSQRDVAGLQAEVENWEHTYEGLIIDHEAEVESARFTFYYVKPEQRYGVDDLQEYLQRWKWREGAYVAGKFDCSQMSAYLERKLENEGYNTVIIAGDSPSGAGKHAWLLVETSEGKYMPVEATAFSIVYWQDTHFDNYFVYDYEFETIHEALEYSPLEFNWWE